MARIGPPGRPPWFQPGDEVKVFTTREGFAGAWSDAKVECRVRTGNYLVSYKYIVDPADTAKPLREVVRAAHIRRGSPLRQNTALPSRIPPIPPPPNPSPNKLAPIASPPAPGFQPGDQVEVFTKREGFRGGWYEARVDSCSPSGQYLVVHKSLMDAVDPSQPLRETVPVSELRPHPPSAQQRAFAVGESIEAFHKGGWWYGWVSELPGEQGARDYSVFLPKIKERIMCSAELMHRCLRWVEGAWVPGGEQIYTSPQSVGSVTTVTCAHSSSAFSSKIACDNNALSKRHTEAENTEDSSFRAKLQSLRLSKDAKTEGKEEHARLPADSLGGFLEGSIQGVRERVTGKRRKNYIPQKCIIQKRRIIDMDASTRGDSVGDRQESTLVNTLAVENYSTLPTELVTQGDTDMNRSDEHVLPDTQGGTDMDRSDEHVLPDTQGDTDMNRSDEHVLPDTQGDTDMNRSDEHVLPDTQGDTDMNRSDEHVLPDTIVEIPCLNTLGTSNSPNQLHEVGAEQAALVSTRSVDNAGDLFAPLSNGSHSEVIPSIPVNKPEVEGYSTPTTELIARGDTDMKRSDEHELPNMIVDIPSPNQQHEVGTEYAALLSTPRADNAGDLFVSLSNGSHSKVIPSIPVNKPAVEGHSTLETEIATQRDPVTKSLDGHELPNLNVEASKSKHQDDEAGKRQDGLLSTPRFGTAGDVVSPLANGSHSKAYKLPFEKRSPTWQYIDRVVMPKMRQQPHFRPLELLPEVQREGSAVGLVVTYEHLMSDNCSLKMDSSCQNLDKNLKSIIDLEEHGFEVQHIRARLEKLARVKVEREQLLQKKSARTEEALEIKEKRDQLNSELESTEKTVMALKQALRLFDGRRSSLSKQKEVSESFLSKLQRDASLAEEEFASIDRTFQDLLVGVQ